MRTPATVGGRTPGHIVAMRYFFEQWRGGEKAYFYNGGRYWDRTSGPARVKRVLYR